MTARQAKTGDTVKVHYRGTFNDGKEFESTFNGDPLTFEVGSKDIIPGFSHAVTGMAVGEKKSVRLPVKEAYGPYRDNFVFQVERDAFPPEAHPEPGQVFEMVNEKGKTLHVTVLEIREDVAILDANHHLAGKELNFEIELLDIVSK